MPNRALEEENIDRLLAHFQQHGQSGSIQEWRQGIENKDARLERRPPHKITNEQAIKDFRHTLLVDTGHSKTAQDLLRELLRPIQPKLTTLECWRALAHPPNNPSPELRAYIDRHAKLQHEMQKWEFEATDEQRQHWDELIDLGKWDQYYQELASGFEGHLDLHSELEEELISRFTRARVRPPITLNENDAEEFHSSGLFWLAANIVFKRLGLDERVERSVIAWMEEHWKKSRVSKDDKPYVFGKSYAQVRKKLLVRGAHTVKMLDRFLAITVKNLMIRETGYDPNSKRKKVMLPKYPGSDLIFYKGDDAPVPDFEVILDTVQNRSPESFQEQDAIVDSFLHSLPDRHRNILMFSMANPDATDKETAAAFGISTKTIQRVRDLAEKRWKHLA